MSNHNRASDNGVRDVVERLRDRDPERGNQEALRQAVAVHADAVLQHVRSHQPRSTTQSASQRRRYRLLVPAGLMSAAGALFTVLSFAGGADLAHAQPATPQLINFTRGTHQQAARQLLAAAERIVTAGQGPVLHSKTQSWALNVDVKDARAITALLATTRELWLRKDGTGRVETSPEVVDVLVGNALAGESNTGTSRNFTPASYADSNSGLSPSLPELAAQLDSRSSKMGLPAPQAQNVYVMTNMNEATATPELIRGFYRALAGSDAVFDAGNVTDRAGRPGHAVGVVSSGESSPTVATEYLIFDEATGLPLERDTVWSPNPPKALHLPSGPLSAGYNLFISLGSATQVGKS
jgi:hypothetical protein